MPKASHGGGERPGGCRSGRGPPPTPGNCRTLALSGRLQAAGVPTGAKAARTPTVAGLRSPTSCHPQPPAGGQPPGRESFKTGPGVRVVASSLFPTASQLPVPVVASSEFRVPTSQLPTSSHCLWLLVPRSQFLVPSSQFPTSSQFPVFSAPSARFSDPSS